MKSACCLLIGLLSTTTPFAQGRIVYTWHGNSGLFQSSFQVPAEQNQPGQYFESGLFKATLVVTSPDRIYPVAGGYFSGEDASGYGPPLTLSVTMTDQSSGTGVHVVGGGLGQGFYLIGEYPLANPSTILWRESGFWTSVPTPEPSMLSLAAIAAILSCTRAGCSFRLRRRPDR